MRNRGTWENCSETERLQDDIVQMQQQNTVLYYRKPREAHGKVGSQQKNQNLDHTHRPAEERQKSRDMLESKPGLFNTKKQSQWKTQWKNIGLTVTHWGTELNKTHNSPHCRESCYFCQMNFKSLRKTRIRWAQGKKIVTAGKAEQMGRMMQRPKLQSGNLGAIQRHSLGHKLPK